MSVFKDKVLLITGGTGSFGNAVLRRFLTSDIKEIRIFSRDEKKQDDMRHHLQAQYPEQASKVKFYIGNVRNRESVDVAMRGVDYVFAAAALKQVPSCEFFPMEAAMTNVMGTSNVLLSAIDHGVKNVVVLSTDKAAYPINAMGISKALMEKVAIAKGRELGEGAQTTICCTRYGNVMASRGSVIPLWVEQIMLGKSITITDPNMTRFMMTLDDAVDLVIYAFTHGHNGDLFVQKAPAATLDVLAEALKQIYSKIDPKYGETEVKVSVPVTVKNFMRPLSLVRKWQKPLIAATTTVFLATVVTSTMTSSLWKVMRKFQQLRIITLTTPHVWMLRG